MTRTPFNTSAPHAIPLWLSECIEEVVNDLESISVAPRIQFVRYGLRNYSSTFVQLFQIDQADQAQAIDHVMEKLLEAETDATTNFDPIAAGTISLDDWLERTNALLTAARHVRALVQKIHPELENLDLLEAETSFRAGLFGDLNLPTPRKEAGNVPTNPETQRIARLKN
jgi:hypothetical protein